MVMNKKIACKHYKLHKSESMLRLQIIAAFFFYIVYVIYLQKSYSDSYFALFIRCFPYLFHLKGKHEILRNVF